MSDDPRVVRQDPYVVRQDPVVVHQQEPPVIVRNNSLTAFAFIKYAFALAITIVVLYFLARYVIPLIGD